MDSPRFQISETISRTAYFKVCLERLLLHMHPVIDCVQIMVKVILHGPSGCGKSMLIRSAARALNMKLHEERMSNMIDDNVVSTDLKVRSTLNKLVASEPCIIYLSGFEMLCYLEDRDLEKIESSIKDSLEDLLKKSSQPILLVAATSDYDKLSKTSLPYLFHHNVPIMPPSLIEANELLATIKSEAGLKSDLSGLLSNLSNQDKDFYLGNILDEISKSEVLLNTRCTGNNDLALEKRDTGTRWLDVGGLADIKDEIIDAIQLSMDYPQLKKSGLRRVGILLHGRPGTGKTLLAKAVANECNLKFFNVKGPELLNEYVGQSEDNVRRLFKRARDSNPSVIFFDEIDSLAPNRGQAGDSGGVMDRMVSQLLAEFDNICKCDGVYVIAATNRVDLVDPSLLRPGRFDKVLEVPLPTKSVDRIQILEALTRKMKLSDDVDLSEIETLAKPNMSGADFQGLCSRALHRSFDRCVHLVETSEKTEDQVEIVTRREDFLTALEEL